MTSLYRRELATFAIRDVAMSKTLDERKRCHRPGSNVLFSLEPISVETVAIVIMHYVRTCIEPATDVLSLNSCGMRNTDGYLMIIVIL